MHYQLLGSSGLRVSELCLGTMTFGGAHAGAAVDDGAAQGIIDEYREAGGNFIDTANIYSRGESELLLGRLLPPIRHRVVLATKYVMSMDPADPNAAGSHRKNLVQSVEASLKRLQTDYIDLLWVHAWDRHTPTAEVMRGLDDLVRAGKVLYVGASNTPAWRVAEANTLAELRGWTRFDAVQVQYSLVQRTIEAETLPMCRALGLSVLAWSPLAGGLLTGKYQDPDSDSGRLRTTGYGKMFLTERNAATARAVVDIAAALHATPGQVALNWLLRQGAIPVLGGTRPGHFTEAYAATGVHLTDEQLATLDELTRPEPQQPGALFPRIEGMVYGSTGERIVGR
jgi:aryl-alcohol dehydrogenase-like predicted oxidoreductase